MKIKDCIQGKCTFQYYRCNELWYETENGFLFPVPISDTGEATFNSQEKGIMMMRYIRKYLEEYNNGQ